MPIYEFQCEDCGKRFEELVSLRRNTPPACPVCKSENTHRLLSAVTVRGQGATSANACAPRGAFS